MIKFSTQEKENFTLVEFEIEGGVCTPDDLRELKSPKVDFTKGVIISGRGPVWLYAYLVHEFHPARWVGTFDPRLGGGVVVTSHTPEVKVGDVVKV